MAAELTTGQGEEAALHARIEEERKEAFPHAYLIQEYRDYTAGRQPTTLSTEQEAIVGGITKKGFCDNVTRRVVSTIAARVRVERMQVGEKDTTKPVETYLQTVWTLNAMRALTARVHFSAVRDGTTYVSLGWSNEKKRVTITRELAWNGKRGTFMAVDDAGEPVYAVKQWTGKYPVNPDSPVLADYERRVIWYDNKIGRFILKENGWQWFREQEGEETSAGWEPWTQNGQENGEALGIPCVMFARKEQPEDGAEQGLGSDDAYGTSVINGGFRGVQDVINNDHWAINAAKLTNAYQILWATGVKTKDVDGNPVTLKMMPGAVLKVEDKEARFGAITAGSLAPLHDTLKVHHETASRNTNTPSHVISGQWPSGAALLEADRPLVDQANALCDSFGPSWASVMHKAVLIANAFGQAGIPTEPLISTVFYPTERGDLASLAAVASIVAPYVSNREILRILRYTPDKIEEIMRERAQEASFLLGEGVPGSAGASATQKNAQSASKSPAITQREKQEGGDVQD